MAYWKQHEPCTHPQLAWNTLEHDGSCEVYCASCGLLYPMSAAQVEDLRLSGADIIAYSRLWLEVAQKRLARS